MTKIYDGMFEIKREACLRVSETEQVFIQTGRLQDCSGNLVRIGHTLNLGGAQDLVTTWR